MKTGQQVAPTKMIVFWYLMDSEQAFTGVVVLCLVVTIMLFFFFGYHLYLVSQG
jgi:hypothetical protein